MCGRFAVTLPPEVFREALDYVDRPDFPPRYNVAPSEPVAVVLSERGTRRFRLMRWGLLPSWVKDPRDFPLLFNARVETMLDKAAFRAAATRRRCVFLADGFYEWQRIGRARQPYLVRRRDRGPMPLAGLWETFSDASGGEIDTACIVTTDANGLVAAIHDRMPVVLALEDVARWLDVDGVTPAQAARLAKPYPDDALEAVPVGSAVNKAGSEGPALQEPLPGPTAAAPEAPRQGSLF